MKYFNAIKITKILFICALLLFPLGEILRIDMGEDTAIRPLDVIVFLIFICSFFIKTHQNKSHNLPIWIIFLFPFIGILSLIINTYWLNLHDFLVSSLYIVRWVAYTGIFLALTKLPKDFLDKAVFLILLDGAVIIIIGFFQYTFFNSLKPLFYLGWDEHMHRLFSSFLDPNFAGIIITLYFLFILHNFFVTQKIKIYLAIPLSLSCVIAIFLTFSRSALIAIAVSSIIYLFLINQKKIVLLIIASFIFYFIISANWFYDENMNLLRLRSTESRISTMSDALMIGLDHFFTGVGFNSYRYAKDFYGLTRGWVQAPSHADAGADNSLLFVFATTGVIGLTSYLLLWAYFLKISLRLYRKKSFSFSPLVLASFSAVLINSLFINSLFYTFVMFWMWLLLAFIYSEYSR